MTLQPATVEILQRLRVLSFGERQKAEEKIEADFHALFGVDERIWSDFMEALSLEGSSAEPFSIGCRINAALARYTHVWRTQVGDHIRLTPAEKKMAEIAMRLRKIGERTGKDEISRHSVEFVIREIVGIDKRTVSKYIDHLAEIGFIESAGYGNYRICPYSMDSLIRRYQYTDKTQTFLPTSVP